MDLIEPISSKLSSANKITFARRVTGIFYVGYGRNAWHSIWVNKYWPNCFTSDFEEAKRKAEERRVQGSQLWIQRLEGLVLYTSSEQKFVLIEINNREPAEYRAISRDLFWAEPYIDFSALPAADQNWLYLLDADGVYFSSKSKVPTFHRAKSIGSDRCLDWQPEVKNAQPIFSSWADELRDRLNLALDKNESQV